MSHQEDDFYRELLSMFKIEAEEHIKNMSSGLLDLEKETDVNEQLAFVETIYREAHSLKGAARAVNLSEVELLCQSLESIFAKLKKQEMLLSSDLFDGLHRGVDALTDLIDSPQSANVTELLQLLNKLEAGGSKNVQAQEEKPQEEKPKKKIKKAPESKELPVEKKKIREKQPEVSAPEPKKEENSVPDDNGSPDKQKINAIAQKDILSDTIRISSKKLDGLLLEAEELLAVKLTVDQYAKDLRDVVSSFEVWKKQLEKSHADIRSARQHVDKTKKRQETEVFHQDSIVVQQENASVGRVLDFIDWNNMHLKVLEDRLITLNKLAEVNAHVLTGKVDILLDDMKTVLMLPFSTLFKILPKVVRDLSRDQGKEVELLLRGSTIEVDRRILEEMKDPLIHIIRNCIDHGLEKPEERKKLKKSTLGTITITVSQMSGNKVEILINDDGKGIDPERVKQVAIKKGIISAHEAEDLSDQQCISLIFQSDISTSRIITDISGRGLGLAIVREKVEKLGGVVSIETKKQTGTTFKIVLPVTLATFRGILVEVETQVFVVPTNIVERVIRIKESDIKTIENRETITVDNKVVSLVKLGDVLQINRKATLSSYTDSMQVLIIGKGNNQIGFMVDKVLSEQEVLVKNLGKQLTRVRNIAGASILGSGKVVPILNISDLLKSALKISASSLSMAKKEAKSVTQRSILIAEDSITSRTLLKNILESAGYRVRATVDGVDALTALRSEEFDLVVSDIEMPRMNGFDLVQKIRSEKKTAELPVVLVTALESREDRERGIDVGANAYIVKRSFDQSNLLEVIEKLI